MLSWSLSPPTFGPLESINNINDYVRRWLDHYFHRALTCMRCLPWWIFVKKQNTTFIEINKRLRWQSDLLSTEEAHFSLAAAIATRKDVLLLLLLLLLLFYPGSLGKLGEAKAHLSNQKRMIKNYKETDKEHTQEPKLAFHGFLCWNTRSERMKRERKYTGVM